MNRRDLLRSLVAGAALAVLPRIPTKHVPWGVQTARRVRGWRDDVRYIDPSQSPLLKILAKIPTQPVLDADYRIWE